MIDEWGFFMKRMMDFEIEDQAFVVFYLHCPWNNMIKLKTKKKGKKLTWVKEWLLERNAKEACHSILKWVKVDEDSNIWTLRLGTSRWVQRLLS